MSNQCRLLTTSFTLILELISYNY